MGSAIRSVTSSMNDVVRSEIQLAKAELKNSAGKLAGSGAQIGFFGGIALAGIFPFMAFLVVGLGEILGNNYWLSSLIVSVVFFVFGGGLAYRAYMRAKDVDYAIPETRRSVESEADVVQNKVRQLRRAT